MNAERQVNVPLLRKAVEWAEAEAIKPVAVRQWQQARWRTPPEVVAFDAAKEQLGKSASWGKLQALSNELTPACDTAFCIAGYVGQMLDGRYAEAPIVDGVHVRDFAAEALGLEIDASSPSVELFDYDNTAADIRRIAEELAGEPL